MPHPACGRGRRGLFLMTFNRLLFVTKQQTVVPRTKPLQVIATLVCIQAVLGAVLVIAFSPWSFPFRDSESDVLFAGQVLRGGWVNESFLVVSRLAASATINTLNNTTSSSNNSTTNELQFPPFRVVVWNKRAQDAVVTAQKDLPARTTAFSIHAADSAIKSLIDTLRAADAESSAAAASQRSESPGLLRSWWEWLRAAFSHDEDDEYYFLDNTDGSDLDDCGSDPAKSEQKESGGGSGGGGGGGSGDHDAATTNRNGSNVGIETVRRREAEEVRGKGGGASEQEEEKTQRQKDEGKLGGKEEEEEKGEEEEETGVRHILFNIASSNASFSKRVRYIRAWWRPEIGAASASASASSSASASAAEERLRGYVWVDHVANISKALQCGAGGTPRVRVSSSTEHLSYRGKAIRDYVRMARVVVDAYRLGEKNVRWYVMGDDDTFFSPRAIAAFLQQYDHRAPLYLGSTSETHMQNVDFTRTMAFGGAGFAVSAALAEALSAGEGMDPCLERHAKLRGSDERVAACVGELGVSLTLAPGFHQCDLHKSLFGLLMSHPAQPLLSLHHFDIVDPILKPLGIKSRAQGLAALAQRIRPDPIGFAQLAVCGDGSDSCRSWSGQSARLSRLTPPPHPFAPPSTYCLHVSPSLPHGPWQERQLSELERAERTFESFRWHKRGPAFTFDTRRKEPNAPTYRPCGLPFTLYANHVGPLQQHPLNDTRHLNDTLPHNASGDFGVASQPRAAGSGRGKEQMPLVSVYNRIPLGKTAPDRSHCPLSISRITSAYVIRPEGPMRIEGGMDRQHRSGSGRGGGARGGSGGGELNLRATMGAAEEAQDMARWVGTDDTLDMEEEEDEYDRFAEAVGLGGFGGGGGGGGGGEADLEREVSDEEADEDDVAAAATENGAGAAGGAGASTQGAAEKGGKDGAAAGGEGEQHGAGLSPAASPKPAVKGAAGAAGAGAAGAAAGEAGAESAGGWRGRQSWNQAFDELFKAGTASGGGGASKESGTAGAGAAVGVVSDFRLGEGGWGSGLWGRGTGGRKEEQAGHAGSVEGEGGGERDGKGIAAAAGEDGGGGSGKVDDTDAAGTDAAAAASSAVNAKEGAEEDPKGAEGLRKGTSMDEGARGKQQGEADMVLGKTAGGGDALREAGQTLGGSGGEGLEAVGDGMCEAGRSSVAGEAEQGMSEGSRGWEGRGSGGKASGGKASGGRGSGRCVPDHVRNPHKYTAYEVDWWAGGWGEGGPAGERGGGASAGGAGEVRGDGGDGGDEEMGEMGEYRAALQQVVGVRKAGAGRGGGSGGGGGDVRGEGEAAPRSPAPSTRPAEAAPVSGALRGGAGNAERDAVDVYGELGRCEAEERGGAVVRPQGARAAGGNKGSCGSGSAARNALAEAVGGEETAAAARSCWEGLVLAEPIAPAAPAALAGESAEEEEEGEMKRAETLSAGEDDDERCDSGGAGGDADDASLLDGDLLVDILSPPDDGHGVIPAALHCAQHSSAKWCHPPLAFPVPPLSIPPLLSLSPPLPPRPLPFRLRSTHPRVPPRPRAPPRPSHSPRVPPTRALPRAGSLLAPPPAPLGALFSALAEHLSLRVALWRRQRLLKAARARESAEVIGGAEGIGRRGSVRVDARTVRAIVRAQEELRAEVRAWCVAETSDGKAEGCGLCCGDESGRRCGDWGEGEEADDGEQGEEGEECGEAVPADGGRDGGARVWFEWNGRQYYLKPWQAIVGDADFPEQYARIVVCLERWLDDAAAAYVLDGGEWQHVGSPRFCAWIAHVCRFPHWHMPCVARRASRVAEIFGGPACVAANLEDYFRLYGADTAASLASALPPRHQYAGRSTVSSRVDGRTGGHGAGLWGVGVGCGGVEAGVWQHAGVY
ncbi:unnamed protein product [Closterium sp. Yama58-4]|nr:unnamed protein product [Closterium sp. Yama58-4]